MRVTRNKAHPFDSPLRPPCWAAGQTVPNPCAAAHWERVVRNHTDLTGDWYGWKMRGKELVSPDGQRISPERMKGILWRLQAEERLARAKRIREAKEKAVRHQSVKVVVVDLADWHSRNVGTMAG